MTDARSGPRAHSRTNRRCQWLVNLSLLTGSLTLALVLAEIVLRILSPGYSPLFLDIYRMDEHGLVLLEPGVNRSHVTAEFRVAVTANSEGLRDRETPVPGENGTILGVGDSLAFGWGVELEESFLYLAEEQLRSQSLRIVKAGIPGSGTGDQMRFLEHYGARYAPRLVVLSFFVGNDFSDVQHGGIPGQFRVQNGLMVKASIEDEETGTPPLWYRIKEKLKRSSLLAQRAAQVLWYFESTFLEAPDRQNPGLNARDRWLWEFAKVHLREPPPETERAFKMTLASLDDVLTWCRERDIELLLVIIPRSIQVYRWELERWKAAYNLEDDDLDLDRPQRVLTAWATQYDVPVLDLLPHFREYAKTRPQDRLYFYPDSHMNTNGHRVTAALLAERLREHLAL